MYCINGHLPVAVTSNECIYSTNLGFTPPGSGWTHNKSNRIVLPKITSERSVHSETATET